MDEQRIFIVISQFPDQDIELARSSQRGIHTCSRSGVDCAIARTAGYEGSSRTGSQDRISYKWRSTCARPKSLTSPMSKECPISNPRLAERPGRGSALGTRSSSLSLFLSLSTPSEPPQLAEQARNRDD